MNYKKQRNIFITTSIATLVVLVGILIYQIITRGDTLFLAIILSCYGGFVLAWSDYIEKNRKKNDN